MKNGIIAVVLVAVLGALGFVAVQHSSQPTTADNVAPAGAAAGPFHYVHEYFLGGLTKGGRIATSSSATSQTLDASNLTKDNTRIDFTPNVSGITLTLPATSTLKSIVPTPGDTREYVICNATTTAATPFTLAFGTGLKNQNASSTYAIAPQKCAQVIFSRKANTDIDALFDLYL